MPTRSIKSLFAGMLILLGGCASELGEGEAVPADEPVAAVSPAESATESAAPPLAFQVAGEEFAFAQGALLQTWPDLAARPARQYARLAVQVPAAELAPAELAGLTEIVQVDVLLAGLVPAPTPALGAAFADWTGREAEPAGSVYKYTITSNRAATGTRVAYMRQWQPRLGLHSLAPFQPQPGTPIYVFGLDDREVTTLIVCQPLPLGYHGADHCSLARRLDDEIGYRVLFPQDLLVHWQAIDQAAREYVLAARL